MGLVKMLIPDRMAESVYTMDFKKEYERGIRGIIFDIDNTLVPHGYPADERAKDLFEELKRCGIKGCIVSNNHEKRVRPFAEALGAFYVFDAGKPKKAGYLSGMKEMGTGLSDTLVIGDQLITDILGAKRLKVESVCVRPIDLSTDPPFVKFKRILEKIVFRLRKEK